MTETDFLRFIKNNAIQSKLADEVIVESHGSEKFVFVRGYPMTVQGFYNISSKAIFGKTIKMKPDVWEKLHAETKVLCSGLDIPLAEGKEALSAVDAIVKAIGLTEANWNNVKIDEWLLSIRSKLEN